MAGEKVRLRGVVVRFSNEKGYGFIKPNDGGDDLFVHHSDVKSDGFRTLSSGQEVEYVSFEENDRFKAIEVTAPGGGVIESVRVGGRAGYGYNDGYNRRNGNGDRNGSGGGGGGECYTCGRIGHLARDCDVVVGGGGASGGGRECYTCGRIGHFARECRQGEGAVVAPIRGGGRSGGGGGGGAGCYNCGGYGHMSRECPSERTGGCYTCGEPGHIARDCLRGGNNGGGGGRDGGGGVSRFKKFGSGNDCFHCGVAGHFVRDCPDKK